MNTKLGMSYEIGNTDSSNAFVSIIVNTLHKDIDVWKVDCFTASETYCDTSLNDPLSSEMLLELLSNCKQIMFIRILRKNNNAVDSSISTYEDFLNSNYDVCIFCYDVGYYEVYSKNSADIDALDNSIPESMYLNKELFYSIDDVREVFLV